MITRSQQRQASAEYLNEISRDELFERFGITRTADITGLDCIGVPVYSCVRPAAKVISVSAGKNLVPSLARAGAVAEAIEFATFENPVGYNIVRPFPDLGFPTCKDSTWNPDVPISIESAMHYESDEERCLPSDLIWLSKIHGTEQHFMRSSNGQAVGFSFEDAFCQGLCECVERDQLTLRRLSLERLNVYPPLIDMDSEIPESIRELRSRCTEASLKLYLFYCASDIPLPTYWAMLLDQSGTCGTFSGWGTHVRHQTAAERAILEAIQSRCVYIAGARDDIERRKFTALKDADLRVMVREIESKPKTEWAVGHETELSVIGDLSQVLWALREWREKIYYRHIDLGGLHAVKTIILGLEHPMNDQWREMRWGKLYERHRTRETVS